MTLVRPLPSPGIALRIEQLVHLPAVLTQRLGLMPTTSKEADSSHLRRRNHYWIHRFRAGSEEAVEADVAMFLASLRPHREFLVGLRDSGGKTALYLTWSAGRPRGFEFEFGTIAMMSDLKLDLYLEVFGGSSSDADPEE